MCLHFNKDLEIVQNHSFIFYISFFLFYIFLFLIKRSVWSAEIILSSRIGKEMSVNYFSLHLVLAAL